MCHHHKPSSCSRTPREGMSLQHPTLCFCHLSRGDHSVSRLTTTSQQQNSNAAPSIPSCICFGTPRHHHDHRDCPPSTSEEIHASVRACWVQDKQVLTAPLITELLSRLLFKVFSKGAGCTGSNLQQGTSVLLEAESSTRWKASNTSHPAVNFLTVTQFCLQDMDSSGDAAEMG